MEFAFDLGGDEFDEDDDDEDEAYFSFGGRGGEADILNAMLMGQMMGGIYSLTHSLTHLLTHSCQGGLHGAGRGGANHPRFGDFMLNNMMFSVDDDDEEMDSDEVVSLILAYSRTHSLTHSRNRKHILERC